MITAGIDVGSKTIKIVVLKIRGSQVQLGIQAPKDVIIRRSELEGSGAKPVVAAA